MNFWYSKDEEYKSKIKEVYKEQLIKLQKLVPEFKIANAILHLEELSPHLHIVGVPIKDGYTNGMKKQVAKSQIFNKDSLKILQDSMRKHCIQSFNKIYSESNTLRTKQKGFNSDEKSYNRKQMIKLLEQEKENRKLLEKANKKTQNLKKDGVDIKDNLFNLKKSPLSNDKYIISKQEIDNIKNYIKNTTKATDNIISINSFDSTINSFKKYISNEVNEISNVINLRMNKVILFC